eukprot:scaffold13049_cov100-Skeletonema_dohrnii-CCMP3373.AAC.2
MAKMSSMSRMSRIPRISKRLKRAAKLISTKEKLAKLQMSKEDLNKDKDKASAVRIWRNMMPAHRH